MGGFPLTEPLAEYFFREMANKRQTIGKLMREQARVEKRQLKLEKRQEKRLAERQDGHGVSRPDPPALES